jgi:hypothetical protein
MQTTTKKSPLRPYTPGGRGLPICGQGKEKQIDLGITPTLGALSVMLDEPPKGSSFPELVALTKRLNAVVSKKAGELLRKKRESTGEKRLELTLALDRGRLYLTYSVPVGRRRVQGD